MGIIKAAGYLTKPLEPYTDFDIAKIHCEEIIEEVIKLKDVAVGYKGLARRTRVVRGIAANQVLFECGRMFLFRRRGFMKVDKEYTVCVNPTILKSYGKRETHEGCLSVGDKNFTMIRPRFVLLEFYDLDGRKHKKFYGPNNAHVIAHEIDHLDGKLISGKGK